MIKPMTRESISSRIKRERGSIKETKDNANGLWGIAFKNKTFLEKCFFVNGFENNFKRFLKTFAQSGNLLL